MKVVTRKIKVRQSREGEPCPRWPNCACIAQGYLNLAEPNGCGRKPRTRRVVHEEEIE